MHFQHVDRRVVVHKDISETRQALQPRPWYQVIIVDFASHRVASHRSVCRSGNTANAPLIDG